MEFGVVYEQCLSGPYLFKDRTFLFVLVSSGFFNFKISRNSFDSFTSNYYSQ